MATQRSSCRLRICCIHWVTGKQKCKLRRHTNKEAIKVEVNTVSGILYEVKAKAIIEALV